MMKCADLKYVAVPVDDQSRHNYDFTPFESIPTKTDYVFISMGSHIEAYDAYERIVLLWMEFPNCLIHSDPNNVGHYSKLTNKLDRFVRVMTNCPFSVDYFNRVCNTDKFQFAFHPIDPKNVPPEQEKRYDVFYAGHFPCAIDFAIPTINKFNACIVSKSGGKFCGVPYKEKMLLNAQSKITLTHGLLNWRDPSTKQRFPGHVAFEHLDQSPIVPQIKVRTFEAAMSKSLILSLHDPWNMIESYLEPDKDFLYWYNIDDLEEKIRHILANYDRYKPMVESAYNKVMENFTTKHFFDQFLRDL